MRPWANITQASAPRRWISTWLAQYSSFISISRSRSAASLATSAAASVGPARAGGADGAHEVRDRFGVRRARRRPRLERRGLGPLLPLHRIARGNRREREHVRASAGGALRAAGLAATAIACSMLAFACASMPICR